MMDFLKRTVGLWIPLLVVAGIAAYPLITGSDSNREAMFSILLAIALASSLNILLGYTGYVSFGHIVFFGIGGYAGLYVMTVLGWNIWFAVLLGATVAGLIAYLLGSAILRLRGGYFALATIGVNEAMRALTGNIDALGGPIGMDVNFSLYKPFGGPGGMLQFVFWSVVALTVLVIIISFVVKKSKFGLGLQAIREDEDAAEDMGVVAPRAKTWAYVLSAIIPGALGVLFFFKNGHIEPGEAFRLALSIEMIVWVMLGGIGTVLGPVVGAGLYQETRKLLLTNAYLKNIQLAVAGALLLAIVLFVPAGIVGWLRSRNARLRKVLE